RRDREDPEINLIPFIDVLLVVLIFLMLTATFSRYTQLQVRLPEADAEAEAAQTQAHEIVVAIGADGRYAVGGQVLTTPSVQALTAALQQAALGQTEPTLVINADAAATHQSVINAMEAARNAGLQRITFATQQPRER
ncbi:MAG: biopolymer transporter ExbD, partial [Comamonadaceae bacterium]|nr:biopolymer transporter ExbD [Comamonadaceae bacterium]